MPAAGYTYVFGGGGGTGSVFAQAGDKPFVRVAAGTGSTRGSAILVQENSPIKTLSDLKGKKVAFAKGSGQHYIIVRALEKVSLKYSDIKPLYLTPAEALPAFERGDIDAWLILLNCRTVAENIAFAGEQASQPIFATLARNFDVDVNILSGSVETVGDRRVGQFHVELEGQKVTQALKYLHEAEFEVQVH